MVSGACSPTQLARQLGEGAAPGAVRRAAASRRRRRSSASSPARRREEDERELRAANRRPRARSWRCRPAASRTCPSRTCSPPTSSCARPARASRSTRSAARLPLGSTSAATPLAARVPVLRDAVCDHLIESFSRKNAILGVAIFVPGADFPVLTLNQLRLVLRLAAAHGVELDQSRLPEMLATIGAGPRLPRGRAPAARRRPGGGLGGQGRYRLRGHARRRRGGEALLRHGIAPAAQLTPSARRPKCRPVAADLRSAEIGPTRRREARW